MRKNHNANYDDAHQPSDNILTLLGLLREQHTALKATLADLNLPTHSSSMHQSFVLPAIRDEDLSTSYNQDSIRRSVGSASGTSHRNSMTTMRSGTDGSVWFDAHDGEGADFYELAPDPEVLDDEDEVTRILHSQSESTISQGTRQPEPSVDSTSVQDTPMYETEPAFEIARRNRLPTKPMHDEGSLLGVLRKNIGQVRYIIHNYESDAYQAFFQDLANIVLPVTFNEPLTLLQRTAEEMEYHELLDKAAASDDWIERLSYVAAFAVSGYASTKHRSGLKGLSVSLLCACLISHILIAHRFWARRLRTPESNLLQRKWYINP